MIPAAFGVWTELVGSWILVNGNRGAILALECRPCTLLHHGHSAQEEAKGLRVEHLVHSQRIHRLPQLLEARVG